MNVRISSLSFALAVPLALLVGCASEPASRIVSAPPPPAPTSPSVVVVTQNPPGAPQAQQVGTVVGQPGSPNSYVVVQAPPVAPPEAVPTQPTSQHVWIAGYWTWQNGRYAWRAGNWEVPPHPRATWTNPRWEAEGNAYRFHEGYWR